jgi:hypothetical protein
MADEVKTRDDTAAKKLAEDKKTLEQNREERQKAMEERAKTRGKPTPTQAELDLIALGNHPDLEPDGSPLENPPREEKKKEMHASSSSPTGSYSTREHTATDNKKQHHS